MEHPAMMEDDFVRIGAEEMQSVLYRCLVKFGFREDKAALCAGVFTTNSLEGVISHCVNRFPRLIEYVRQGWVRTDAAPALKKSDGAWERWDGQMGAGPLNAIEMTDRCMQIASENTIGCIGLSNTNHWMRGGFYGRQAARKGYAFIGWTNTIANMPAWNALDNRLGNNPLVMAVPFEDDAVVLDMAMSQFSFGAMESAAAKGMQLPVAGGFDVHGNLSKDPQSILDSRRPLPAGLWKGAALSLLLDLLAVVFSGGASVHEITSREAEFGISQVFICIDCKKLGDHSALMKTIHSILNDYQKSAPAGDHTIVYPGERVKQRRAEAMHNGIGVHKPVWRTILEL